MLTTIEEIAERIEAVCNEVQPGKDALLQRALAATVACCLIQQRDPHKAFHDFGDLVCVMMQAQEKLAAARAERDSAGRH